MDSNMLFTGFGYSAGGILLWREDGEGNIWGLLARRRMEMLLGPVHAFSIPLAAARSGEDVPDAAVRALHDELGLMADRSKLSPFWKAKEGNISVTLYSQRVSSALVPKCRGSYTDGTWFCITPDGCVEDCDMLTRMELRSFLSGIGHCTAAI